MAYIPFLAVLVSLMTAPVSGRTDSGTPEEPPSLMIQFQHGYLRVKLHNAPWEQVLYEIERQTGVAVQVKGKLAGTVNQAFDALPLDQGLRLLFHNINLMMFYARKDGTETRINHVWLVPNPADTPQTKVLTSPADIAHELDERFTALQTFATQGDLEKLQQALFDPDQEVQTMALDLLQEWGSQEAVEALLNVTTSDQPAIRVRALTLLHETDLGQDEVVLSALAQALMDPDVTVKAYALHALTERGGAEAVDAMGQALHDPDTSIRQMAIERIAASKEGRPLLNEALSNDDDTVRTLAAFWLEAAPAAGQ